MDDPLLIDGYKFDIGLYTMITSIDPLRIYVFEGDVLLRFCPGKIPLMQNERSQATILTKPVHDPTLKDPSLTITAYVFDEQNGLDEPGSHGRTKTFF